jgi:hypothetical protein
MPARVFFRVLLEWVLLHLHLFEPVLLLLVVDPLVQVLHLADHDCYRPYRVWLLTG